MIFLDDNYPEHPKIVAAGGDAAWLDVCALGWLKRAGSEDGRVPKAVVPRLSDRRAPEKLAERLCDVGRWHDDGDAYLVHGYVERNAKAIATSKKRKAASEARWAKERSKRDANEDANASGLHVQNGATAIQGTVNSEQPSSGSPVDLAHDASMLAAKKRLRDRQGPPVADQSAWLAKVAASWRDDHADELRTRAAQCATATDLLHAVEGRPQRVREQPIAPDNGGNPDLTGTADARAAARAVVNARTA